MSDNSDQLRSARNRIPTAALAGTALFSAVVVHIPTSVPIALAGCIGVGVISLALDRQRRRPNLIVITTLVLAIVFGVRTRSEIVAGSFETRPGLTHFSGVLLTDPTESYGNLVAVMAVKGTRLRVIARGVVAAKLSSRMAGEHLSGLGASESRR